jgi:nucleotide-binding universal stress UspA family protein
MYRSIVVPLDGSRFAERAIPLAGRIARAADATLHLVMVQDPTQGLGPFAEFGPPSVLLMEELDRQHATYLERTAARLRRAGRIRVKPVSRDGFAGRVIVQVAEDLKNALVVMSTHGQGALGRIGIGSVADHVIRHAATPVLLLPAGARLPRGIPGRRILVPTDLSPESGKVLNAVRKFSGLGRGSRITVLHVVEPIPMVALPSLPFSVNPDGEWAERQWEQARQRLARFGAEASSRGLAVSTRVVPGAGAAVTILDQLHQGRFDLVALTTHGYSGFRRLLLGSVTNKVIRNARKPVLVVRPARRQSGRGRSRRAGI